MWKIFIGGAKKKKKNPTQTSKTQTHKEGIEFDEIWNYKLNKKYDDAEGIEELFDRVNNFLDGIQEKYKDKTVLLVTHGWVTVPIRAYFEGIPEKMEVLKELGIENCEIKEYNI